MDPQIQAQPKKMNMFICVCLITMLVLMVCRYRYYHVKLILILPLAICIAIMGVLGTYIMFFIENGGWYGKSFFGAVLFFPILLYPVAKIFRMPLKSLLDYAAIPGLALLGIFKWNCYQKGCCGGKAIWFTDGVPTHFPSQLAEMAVAFLLVIILLIIERKPKFKGLVFPMLLVLYGSARYVLNFYRWEQQPFLLGMTAGNFWALIAVCIGTAWIFVSMYRQKFQGKNPN